MARGKVYTTAPLLYNDQGDPIPQYLDVSDKTDSPQGSFKPLTNDPQDVRLIGSITKELRSYVDDDTFAINTNEWRYISNILSSQPSLLRPVDVSNFRKKSIYFENNMNHDIRAIQVYGTSESREKDESSVRRDDVRLFQFDVGVLESGEAVFITEEEYPELKQPCIGLAMRTARELGFDPEDSEGTITVRFYGSV